MAKKFGLYELEALGRDVGGLDRQTVHIAAVVSAMNKTKFTAEAEAEVRIQSLKDDVAQLGAMAATIETTATARAKALRADAVKTEEQAKNMAAGKRAIAAANTKKLAEVEAVLGLIRRG